MRPTADHVAFVLLDAFRHDYLGRTRFLADVSRRSLTGRLEEPFGFCPRAAYFGGLTPAQQGFTNLMHFDPVNSVFRWTREIAGTAYDGVVLDDVRRAIVAEARRQLPPFSAASVDPLAIPLPYLSCFDVSERLAPWDRGVGYRSLFHVLDERGRAWMEVSWPFAGVRPVADNASVTGEALRRMRADQAFSYIHLPSLDTLGHQHGPGSVELQRALEETDRLCEMIVARLLELHDDPVIVLAGDHGMMPVVRNVDLASVLQGLGLAFGRDFAYFIDSTMVRCWFFSRRACDLTTRALEATGAGWWMRGEEKTRWGLDGLPQSSGNAFFLAHPGISFFPNFFAGPAHTPPRGMHGYPPEVMDNQAVFLAYRPRARWSGDVGTVNARRLFPSFLRWLGWNPAEVTSEQPVDEATAQRSFRRWTRTANPETEATITRHMERAVDAILARAPDVTAILLTGGFGRGEGTVASGESGDRVCNDYDLLAVGGDGAGLVGLGDELASEFGIEFVDVGHQARMEACEPITQLAFDLRHGSTVIWGDPRALDRLPCFAPTEVSPAEGFYLLGNRLGGLALALEAAPGGPFAASAFVTHQIAKYLIAIADVWLLEARDYHSLYGIRRRRFADLAEGAGFGAQTARWIEQAFAYKLEGCPLNLSLSEGARAASDVLADLGRVLGWRNPREALETHLESTVRAHGVSAAWLDRAEAQGLVPQDAARVDPAGALYDVYRACTAFVLDRDGGSASFAGDWPAILGPRWNLDARFCGGRSVAAAWLAQFH